MLLLIILTLIYCLLIVGAAIWLIYLTNEDKKEICAKSEISLPSPRW